MNKDRVTHILISSGIILAAMVLAVYSWMVLPDMVSTQPASISTGAPPVPKLIAVALPTVLMGMFAYLGPKERKLYWGSLIGVLLHILFWMTN